MDSGYFEQFGNIFYPDVSGSSYAPPPPPPDFYGARASSSAPPFYPSHFGSSSSFGIAASSMMAPLHSFQSEPRHPSARDIAAGKISDALFAPSPRMSNIALDIDPTSLEITTLPENAYVISNLWLDIHEWNSQPPLGGNGNGNGDGQ